MGAYSMVPLFVLIAITGCFAVDVNYTDITIVTDETRYLTVHPDARLTVFSKVHHVKGNYVFTAGERIGGDRLIVNFLEETQFTRAEDIEVWMRYPGKTQEGAILTSVIIYADLTSELADAFFVSGGINQNFAEILIVCNQTHNFGYEVYMYGY